VRGPTRFKLCLLLEETRLLLNEGGMVLEDAACRRQGNMLKLCIRSLRASSNDERPGTSTSSSTKIDGPGRNAGTFPSFVGITLSQAWIGRKLSLNGFVAYRARSRSWCVLSGRCRKSSAAAWPLAASG